MKKNEPNNSDRVGAWLDESIAAFRSANENPVDAKLIAACDESVKARRALEIAIVRRLLEALIVAGYEVRADNGEGREMAGSIDEMVEELFAVDEAHIRVRSGNRGSWIFLVFGNDGWDVVNDYGESLAPIIEPVIEWAEAEHEAKVKRAERVAVAVRAMEMFEEVASGCVEARVLREWIARMEGGAA